MRLGSDAKVGDAAPDILFAILAIIMIIGIVSKLPNVSSIEEHMNADTALNQKK